MRRYLTIGYHKEIRQIETNSSALSGLKARVCSELILSGAFDAAHKGRGAVKLSKLV
jgi:hypothetical protein